MVLLVATPAVAHSKSNQQARPILTVCADPDNLPFSNRAGEGFENRIAALLARQMGVKLQYFWWAQQRGFVRKTLGAAQCDLWPGVPAGLDNVAASQPYYRSSYVFVTRADLKLQGLSFDDPRLRSLAIGVQLIGNDGINTPPAHAIAQRGMTQNVRGYMPYANIIAAVAKGDIDVALAWGPPAGFFASRSPTPLRVEPVTPALDAGGLPMTYAISMGIRRANPRLRQEVDALLEKDKPAIKAILRDYHVPLVPERPATAWAGPK
jgi:mxaJ protein